MKKFLFRLFLAAIIGFFIFFFISGNSLSDLTSDDGPISKSGFVELKDQVLGSFSTESNNLDNIENVVTSTIDKVTGNGEEESSDASSSEGPLSNLLDQFRGEDDSSENNKEKEETTEIDTNTTSTTDYTDQIETNTNLPEFNLVCFPEVKRECNFDGCETKKPDINFTLIDSNKKLIHQCSLDDCKTFNYQRNKYSDSYNYQIQSNDEMYMISREIEPDSSGRTAYAEMRARGVNTSINLGRCLGK